MALIRLNIVFVTAFVAAQLVQLTRSFSPAARIPAVAHRLQLGGGDGRVAPSCVYDRRDQSSCLFSSTLDSIGSHDSNDGQHNSTSMVVTEEVKRLRWKRVLIPKGLEPPSDHDGMTQKDKLVLAATSVSMVLGYVWLIVASGAGAWRFYLAGGICAAASHAIPVPIDVVKTRKQVDPKLSDKTFLDAMRTIVKNEGLNSLLAGLGPTTWGYLAEGSIKWGTYEVLKPAVKRVLLTASTVSEYFGFLNSQLLAFVICGCISGLAASAMVCPMEALRIRLVSEPDFAPKGWIQGGAKMLQQEGVSALWKGMLPMVYKQVPYTVTKNVSFDLITKFAYLLLLGKGVALTSTLKITVPLFAAGLASILSCISSQPGDMLLSLVNAHGGNRRTHDIVKDILRSERGVRGFFVGIKTRFVHVGIIVTLQLLIYDFVKRLCGIAATGTV